MENLFSLSPIFDLINNAEGRCITKESGSLAIITFGQIHLMVALIFQLRLVGLTPKFEQTFCD